MLTLHFQQNVLRGDAAVAVHLADVAAFIARLNVDKLEFVAILEGSGWDVAAVARPLVAGPVAIARQFYSASDVHFLLTLASISDDLVF